MIRKRKCRYLPHKHPKRTHDLPFIQHYSQFLG